MKDDGNLVVSILETTASKNGIDTLRIDFTDNVLNGGFGNTYG